MNLYGLMGVIDVVPTAVRLPTVSDHLDESSAHGRIRHVGDTLAIGLDVQFQLFVLTESAFFDIFHINACIFDGESLVASRNFNGQPGSGIGSRRRRSFGCRGRRVLGGGYTKSRRKKNSKTKSCQFGAGKCHVPVDPIFHGKVLERRTVKVLRCALRCNCAWQRCPEMRKRWGAGRNRMCSTKQTKAAELTQRDWSCNFSRICPAHKSPRAQRRPPSSRLPIAGNPNRFYSLCGAD